MAQDRRLSPICRLERAAGCGIMGRGERIPPVFIGHGASDLAVAAKRRPDRWSFH
jgi:hypothetical protein